MGHSTIQLNLFHSLTIIIKIKIKNENIYSGNRIKSKISQKSSDNDHNYDDYCDEDDEAVLIIKKKQQVLKV